MLSGSCLCGSVTFEADSTRGDVEACHCSQCRKQSGHYWASVGVAHSDFRCRGKQFITWFSASDKARRGFCSRCGSFLFWERTNGDYVALALGSIDAPSRLRLAKHIFVADQGDYYDIADGLPQEQQ